MLRRFATFSTNFSLGTLSSAPATLTGGDEEPALEDAAWKAEGGGAEDLIEASAEDFLLGIEQIPAVDT
jgi:hypothetical protein